MIIDALYKSVGMADDEAAARIVTECRRRAPDATDEEIVFYIRQQAGRIKSRIQNPTGFLITLVPKCFEGESFQRYRELANLHGGRGVAGIDLTECKRVLSDPGASDEERQLASFLLDQTGMG
jgi:hypothetical protein